MKIIPVNKSFNNTTQPALSFKARVAIDYQGIKSVIQNDKFFHSTEAVAKLNDVLRRVGNLSKMEQNSLVILNPRLDNNKLNLITNVWDSTTGFRETVNLRSARKIAGDKDYGDRFVNRVSDLIKNVEFVRENTQKVKEFIENSKTLSDDGFISILPDELLRALDKDCNPIERIISILTKIEKTYPNEKNVVSFKNFSSPKGTHVNRYFCLNNSQGEKKILLNTLFRDYADSLIK